MKSKFITLIIDLIFNYKTDCQYNKQENDNLLISVLGVICTLDTWKEIEVFATSKENS